MIYYIKPNRLKFQYTEKLALVDALTRFTEGVNLINMLGDYNLEDSEKIIHIFWGSPQYITAEQAIRKFDFRNRKHLF